MGKETLTFGNIETKKSNCIEFDARSHFSC